MSDRLVGLMLLLVSAFFYWQTAFFKKPSFSQFEQMGPDFLPRGILIGLAIFSLILLMRGKGSLVPSWRTAQLRALFTKYREVVISLVSFPLYALAIDLIGFGISTVVYLVLMQWVLKPPKGLGFLYSIAGSAVFTWALVTVFQQYLHVILPSGSLF